MQKLDLSYRENINFKQLGIIISNELTYLSLVNSHLQPKDFVATQVKNSKVRVFFLRGCYFWVVVNSSSLYERLCRARLRWKVIISFYSLGISLIYFNVPG